MDEQRRVEIIELTGEQKQAQRSRALGIAISLGLFVLLLYGATFAKLMTP